MSNKPDLVDQVMNELKQNNGTIESLNNDNVVISNESLEANVDVNNQQSNIETNIMEDSTNIDNIERNDRDLTDFNYKSRIEKSLQLLKLHGDKYLSVKLF